MLKTVRKIKKLILLLLFNMVIISCSKNEDTLIIKNDFSDIDMVVVKGGTFLMGSKDGDRYEKPVHSVSLSSFEIGKYEVMQAQWIAVMGDNPSYFKGDSLPVENVSWNDIQIFITKLNEKTNKTYRLPTEAEWEYAASGGLEALSTIYSGSNSIGDVAWSAEDKEYTTQKIGRKQANELGLYDMSGNVSEWCSNWYGIYYEDSVTNPQGPSTGSKRISRGGSWSSNDFFTRITFRNFNEPEHKTNLKGFRLARSL